jgi:hypothetical protein
MLNKIDKKKNLREIDQNSSGSLEKYNCLIKKLTCKILEKTDERKECIALNKQD